LLVAPATQAVAKFSVADECQMNGRRKPEETGASRHFSRKTAPVPRKLQREQGREYAETIDFRARLKGI
jgi:hypothetical protein